MLLHRLRCRPRGTAPHHKFGILRWVDVHIIQLRAQGGDSGDRAREWRHASRGQKRCSSNRRTECWGRCTQVGWGRRHWGRQRMCNRARCHSSCNRGSTSNRFGSTASHACCGSGPIGESAHTTVPLHQRSCRLASWSDCPRRCFGCFVLHREGVVTHNRGPKAAASRASGSASWVLQRAHAAVPCRQRSGGLKGLLLLLLMLLLLLAWRLQRNGLRRRGSDGCCCLRGDTQKGVALVTSESGNACRRHQRGVANCANYRRWLMGIRNEKGSVCRSHAWLGA